MKVSDLIDKLKNMPLDAEVWIYDSYEGVDYHGEFMVRVTRGVNDEPICEVQVGRTMVD